MTQLTVKLAGIPMSLSLFYEENRALFQDYLTQEPPLFSLCPTEADLQAEREMTLRRHLNLDVAGHSCVGAALEDQWLYRQVGERLPAYDALLFHCSAIAVDGEAYLFAAISGTGKSTHARLWRQFLGNRAVMINDDKPLLKFEDDAVLACGSPWRGKHHLGANIQAPIRGICLLKRGAANSITPLSAMEAFPALMRQCYLPNAPQGAAQAMALAERLTHDVPMYRLVCNMEPEAAKIAYAGMKGEETP